MLRRFVPLFVAAVFCVPLLATGCGGQRGYYDPYYHQHYPYAEENSFYLQWESDTHRHHEDFNRRSKAEQKQFWDWRHQHENGNDHGHDHNHDHDQNSH